MNADRILASSFCRLAIIASINARLNFTSTIGPKEVGFSPKAIKAFIAAAEHRAPPFSLPKPSVPDERRIGGGGLGAFAGLISFIPYVGSLIGLVLSIGVAVVQFWPDYIWIAAVAGIFFAGQFLEGNILQPKLVGSSVGLHPVWLMFALFAFASLFGFLGMLIAVPAAAAVGVLVRFALGRYLESDMFAASRGREVETPKLIEPVHRRKPE